jgi:protein tyrosine phosphatase (PTP) superfamily phosphohydrolase (DUF442 family)
MTTALEAIRGVPNAIQPLPELVSGGQPTPRHLEALKAAGATSVIDIRSPAEPHGFDEPAALAALGIEYINIPVGPTPLDDPLMEEVLDALRRHSGATTLFHCASGNRCGGPLVAFLVLDHGIEEKEAISIATRGGLRSREVLEWGLDYIRRHQAT